MENTPLEELLVDAEQEDAAASKAAGKPRLKTLLICAAIAAGSITAAFAVASVLGAPDAAEQEPPPRLADAEEPKPMLPNPSAQQVLYNLDSLIVNLADTEARRYLKASIVLGVKDTRTTQALQERRVMLTDKMIVLLSSKTIDQVDGFEKKEDLKREIRDEVNNLVGIRDAVVNVYFTELIIQ